MKKIQRTKQTKKERQKAKNNEKEKKEQIIHRNEARLKPRKNKTEETKNRKKNENGKKYSH